jgi:putative ABC transport system substrate-binding protein
MNRREVITLLGGAAAAWPFSVRAQQSERVRRIGVLVPLPPPVFAPFFSELRQEGFIEGQNLAVDRQGFDAKYEQFPTVAAGIVKAGPDAILCGGDAAIRTAQAATSSIPIVAITDDIGRRWLGSFARPSRGEYYWRQYFGGRP